MVNKCYIDLFQIWALEQKYMQQWIPRLFQQINDTMITRLLVDVI